MGDYTPVSSDGVQTKTASALITGGQLVSVSGNNTVAPSGVGDHPVGVAVEDVPSGGRCPYWPLPGNEHETLITGSVVIAAGAPIIAAAAGAINTGTLATVAAAGTLLGVCTQGGTGGQAGKAGQARWVGV